jgi:hypothetical protein
MKSAAGVVSLCLAVAWVAVVAASPAGADPPVIDPNTACATDFSALRVDGDPNAVVIVADSLAGPFSGTITAYGHETKWTGTIGRAAVTEHYRQPEASFIVRADGPIEGVEYTPPWASCTFHAVTRSPGVDDESRHIDRPVLIVNNSVAIEPANCPVPYRATRVLRTFEPSSPPAAVYGAVSVAVAIDDEGTPQSTRVVSSPGSVLNPPAVDAARRSTYAPAIFRCQPVPSGYVFVVEFPSN